MIALVELSGSSTKRSFCNPHKTVHEFDLLMQSMLLQLFQSLLLSGICCYSQLIDIVDLDCLKLLMNDIVDLLIVSGVVGVGFIALIYLIIKKFDEAAGVRIKNREVEKKKGKGFSLFVLIGILIHAAEPLKKQSTKRVEIEVEDKLDNKSSFNSSKIERPPCSFIVNLSVQRRKTL
ncbi:unnamed protein product [Cercopithifilaria johnstoni]|uniref:Uncharacterized protein n=1 Tax=Cercopithifilaria johnstoni TaxID=2874296 RepID=A0A8J2M4B2_9BILA|nr:unnamed protein product [Cercopithifilaria johnstoni]